MHLLPFCALNDRKVASLFFQLKVVLYSQKTPFQLSPISILPHSFECLFIFENENFGQRRRNFVHKMSSAVYTCAAIFNSSLPTSNHETWMVLNSPGVR